MGVFGERANGSDHIAGLLQTMYDIVFSFELWRHW